MSGPVKPTWVGTAVIVAALIAVPLLIRLGIDSDRPSRSRWSIPAPVSADMQPLVARRLSEARRKVVDTPSSADAWGRFGAVCDAHRLYGPAATCYRRALALAPDDFRWPYLLATVLESDGAPWEEVAGHLRTAAELQSDYAPAFVRLGELLLRNGRLTEAPEAFERAIALDPELAVAHRGLGQVRLSGNDAPAAIQHLERARELRPDDRAVWVALAQAYMQAGETRRAENASQSAHRLQRVLGVPDPVRAKVEALGVSPKHCAERAAILADAGDFAGAIENLEIVAEARPDYPLVHLQLGILYSTTGQLDPAVEHLSKATQLKDDLLEAHTRLAAILLERNQLSEAIGHLRRAHAHTPTDVAVLTWLGSALSRHGDVDEAVTVFEQAAELAPSDAQIRYNWGTALLQGGEPQQAIDRLQETLRLDRDHADAHFNMAVALEQLGRVDEAIGHYEHAVRIDPDHPAARALAELKSGPG